MLTIRARNEDWPIAGEFSISRGSKTTARVVVATVSNGQYHGRGECVPYQHYGEHIDTVLNDINKIAEEFPTLSRSDLQCCLPAGAARNALDCALWDLEAKQTARPCWQLADLSEPGPVISAYTIGLSSPEYMASKAHALAQYPLLKLKLGGDWLDVDRIRSVRNARPDAALIVDANEAWSGDTLPEMMSVAAECGIELIEQPLPADQDAVLADIAHTVPICADESAHSSCDIARLADLYDAVNIKLDKTGGLSEALTMTKAARARRLMIMVGCMVATSLSMAPAVLVAQQADWVDLDGPLLLARDHEHALTYKGPVLYPPSTELWG